jgi:hypothetical protein
MTTASGQATLLVTAKHNPLAWILYFCKLSVEVDGDAQPGKWGQRPVSVAPGPHDVKVYFKYLMKARCGEAAVNVVATDGHTVAIEYKAPKLMTNPGRIAVKT